MMWNERHPLNLWDAFSEMQRVFDEVGRDFAGGLGADYPTMNLWSNDDGVAITAEMPGVDPKALEISTVGSTLTIRGKRTVSPPVEGATCLRDEIGSLEFARSIQLPFDVDADSAVADYRDGILHLSLKRPESSKPRRIVVSASGGAS
ncbi:MAG TPA: Hsp20/alpha crystallin family protein [Planctomycetota bacterium]|nr:Hsp20/alpha crystallin family protein [Planctomycetota bacterium]